MASKNTVRKQVYITDELDEFLTKLSDETNVRVNDIIVNALYQLKNNPVGDESFSDKVNKLTLEMLKSKGLI